MCGRMGEPVAKIQNSFLGDELDLYVVFTLQDFLGLAFLELARPDP